MKQVHWQLPFGNIDGTKDYRLDIYAEGAPTDGVKTLVGAATPFTTDEDASDDFFEPVRGWTGSINIVDEGGNIAKTMIPADEIDHPVRLIRVNDGAVMWQGFLSCNTYTQEYTDRPNEFTLNVNSVLEAMASVQLTLNDAGFFTVGNLISRLFMFINEKADIGVPMITRFSVPQNDAAVMDKYIDSTVMFDLKQQDNENSTIYEPVGIGLLDIVSRLCRYMGWTGREVGTSVYICNGKDMTLAEYNWIEYYKEFRPSGNTMLQTVEMRDFEYKGTNHNIDTRNGAKSVEVVAKVIDYKLDMQLPECPVGALVESDIAWGDYRLYTLSNTNRVFNNMHECKEYNGHYKLVKKLNSRYQYITDSIEVNQPAESQDSLIPYAIQILGLGEGFPQNFRAAFINPSGYRFDVPTGVDCDFPILACMMKYDKYEGEEKQTHTEVTNALFMCGYTTNVLVDDGSARHDLISPTQVYPINSESTYVYSARSILYFAANQYYINIDTSTIFGNDLAICDKDYGNGYPIVKLTFALSVGDKYWDGSNWVSSFATFTIDYKDGKIDSNYNDEWVLVKTEGWFIPVTDRLVGEVRLMLFPNMTGVMYKDKVGNTARYVQWVIFDKLDVSYVVSKDFNESDRGENHYYKLLGLNFREEVSVKTDLASDLNNKPSPSILMNTTTDPMTTLHYSDGTDERPERVLLARLAEYYGQVRTKISLEVDRPTTPLPLIRVTGYDGKTYLPLSESRDWRADTSTITCFECPE